jgi:hypothetical protein
MIKLTPERLTQIMRGIVSEPNLPADTEILDLKMDLFSKQVSVVVRSDSFEDVAESLPIPELALASYAESKPAPKPATTATVSVKPETRVEPQPSIAKLVPPQPGVNRWASKMENEFSPEQRKLLSFTVKGDVMVVKPVSFLKAEWEDINEVVRSLGGKWVKGDIISYWEIPLQ